MKLLIIMLLIFGACIPLQANPLAARNKQITLEEAILTKNIATTKQLLLEGADVTTPAEDNFTLLHVSATQNPDPAVLKLLVDNGANVNARTQSQNMTALEYIKYNEHPRAAKYLIEAGTDINIGLRYAALYGMSETARQMLTRGAKVDNHEYSFLFGNRTPLALAALGGHSAIIKMLLDRGAHINIKDQYGITPLTFAVKSGSLDSVKLLVEKNTLSTKKLNKLLFITTDEKYDPALAEFMIYKGADINARDYYGRTALHRAVWLSGNKKVAELLISMGAKLNIVDKDGRTPLQTAILSGCPLDLIRKLINTNTDIN
ncbi:MAG: ankyrin repeat domain-containing protein, partial [Thioalkalispiraceae bacterium]